MSVRVMSTVWQTECQSHTQKLVLLAIADNANDEGFAYPSIATIAKKCDLTRVSVMQQIAKLEERGFLRVGRAVNRSNDYYLTLPTGVVNGVYHPQSTAFTTQSTAYTTGSKRRLPDPSVKPSTEPSKGKAPRLNGAERVSLDRERERIEARLKTLKSQGRLDELEADERAELKDRLSKIKEALHIPL